jgi:hypothetical protein
MRLAATATATAATMLTLLLALQGVGPAAAAAPETSPRPMARAAGAGGAAAAADRRIFLVPVSYRAEIRPRPRPRPGAAGPAAGVFAAEPASASPVAAVSAGPLAVARSPRPESRPGGGTGALRPAAVSTAAAAPVPTRPRPGAAGETGRICGDRRLEGRALAPISGALRGCGVDRPVLVSAVDGVALSEPAIMDCRTAKALKDWVRSGLRPAVGRLGGGPAEIAVAAHYTCRTRNGQPGAKLSEHGKGRAIDISGIRLANGTSLSVLRDWDDPLRGRILRRAHGAACGPFGTVLGPAADRHHRDHFHFDTARNRGGAYCR